MGLSPLFLLCSVILALCASQSIIPDECPYTAEILQLPVSCAGMWRENRIRFVSLAYSQLGASSLIVLTGDTDIERYPFRQNSDFYYLTGANMPSYFVSLAVNSSSPTPFTTLFVPAPSADYAIWNGHVYTKDQLRVMYDVDAVLYTNETTNYVNQFPAATTVYTISSSVALPSAFSRFTVNKSLLGSVMITSRATKSDKEIILMTLVNKISSFAHVSAMQFVASRMNVSSKVALKPFQQPHGIRNWFNAGSRAYLASGSKSLHVPLDDVAREAMAKLSLEFNVKDLDYKQARSSNPFYEYEVESLFLYQCGLCGAMQQSYLPIVGAGNDGAILHYIANNNPILNGEMLLIDAGTEYWGYGSDITRTYPVNGVFTDAQRLIYNIVLQTQADVVAEVKAGVTWGTLNTVARDSITKYMLQAGLLQGSFSDLIANAVYNIFYPHGIGHSVGLDVHDAQTTVLEANQVITVEPGVYFNSYLLEQARSSSRSQFVVWEKVDAYKGTGGVRIEDDYVVTADGSYRITQVPSDIDTIEKIMQSALKL